MKDEFSTMILVTKITKLQITIRGLIFGILSIFYKTFKFNLMIITDYVEIKYKIN